MSSGVSSNIYYCPVCGLIKRNDEIENTTCGYCYEGVMIKAPFTIEQYYKESQKRGLSGGLEVLQQDIIFNNELFNPQLARQRRDAENTGFKERQESLVRQKQLSNKPKCPTCGSTDISDISTVSRAISVGMLGLFSGKIGKTKECHHCGYKW